MKPSTIQEIKEELSNLPSKELIELCLRLARYKKENKELLTYLLFQSHDTHGFLEEVKKEIDESFESLPKPSPYLNKKTLRKILRAVSKYSKHTASKQTEVEMLLHFCIKVKASGIKIEKSTTLMNLYRQQIKKINSALESLHEDLTFDYKKQLKALGE